MRWFVILAVLCVGFGARVASAADTYAAIAFSQASGTTGYSNRYASREEAEERALQECGRGCTVVMWVRNSCAALAVGRGNGYGTFRSTDEDETVEGAVNECKKHAAGCELMRMVCSAY